MKQLTQKLGSGEMIIQEVPCPQLGKGMVLVKTHYSIISAGALRVPLLKLHVKACLVKPKRDPSR